MKSKEEAIREGIKALIIGEPSDSQSILYRAAFNHGIDYANQSRWIRVETPKHGNTVLIKDIIGDKHLGYFDTDSLIWRVNGIGIIQADEISGWMELPD